jgi:predicted amidophosphoribosyltransferase
VLKDGEMVCDQCQKPITRVTEAPAEGYPRMHNLCSACFAELRKKSISRPS